jgi:hypothetical protein
MDYRWADAKQILADILHELEGPPKLRSEYPEMLSKLNICRTNVKDTLDLLEQSIAIIKKRLGHEDARAIDVLTRSEHAA